METSIGSPSGCHSLPAWANFPTSFVSTLNHRVAAGEKLSGECVDVPELGVTARVLVSFQGLAGSLQAVLEGTKDFRDHGVTDGVSHLRQFCSEVARRFCHAGSYSGTCQWPGVPR